MSPRTYCLIPWVPSGSSGAGHKAVVSGRAIPCEPAVVRSGDQFEDLVREADAAPIDGWSFEWLDGRAMEERPPWAFTRLLTARVGEVSSLLDLQTGGGEVLSEALGRATRVPDRIAATEPPPPNTIVARHGLARFPADVIQVSNDAPLPFRASSFELVASRHPVVVQWDEIARVLEPGGSYLAQHVGPGTNREVTDFLMGPQPVSD